MKLSVCIFTYNQREFIGQAIESVLTQKTNFDFEIVIGEDCSTDGTRQIVESYQNKYPHKVRAFLNDNNLGVMRNNVYTLSKCNGEYIALLDGDDYWLGNEKLQRQVDFLDEQRAFVLCFHNARVLNVQGTFNEKTCCTQSQKRIVSLTDIIYHTHIPTGSVVFRKEALKGFPPDDYCNLKATDRPLFLFLTESGAAYYFNECWSVYRKHGSGDWTSKNYQSRALVNLQIYRFMDNHFDRKYHMWFSGYESILTYLLILTLIQDGKLLRAKCFIRRFLRIHNWLRSAGGSIFLQVTIIGLLYLRKSIVLSSSKVIRFVSRSFNRGQSGRNTDSP